MILDENKEFIVELVVENLAEVPEDEETLINNALKENSNIAEYYAVKLILKVDGEEIAEIAETDDEMNVVMPISEELPEVKEGYVRTFYTVRIHNYAGVKKAEIIPATVSGNNATSKSNKFSTYALAYVDAEKPVEVEPEENTTPVEETPTEKIVEKSNGPKTRDEFNLGLWMSILVISGISFVGVSKCKTKTRRKSKH